MITQQIPLEHVEMTVITASEEEVSSPIKWQETLQACRDWYVELTGALTQVGEALVAAISSAWSLTWEMLTSPYKRQDSKQTRAYYRVRARAQERQKVRVHAHRRQHRSH